MVKKGLDKNKRFSSGEEGILQQAASILERKKSNYVYTSIIDRKEYVMRLKNGKD